MTAATPSLSTEPPKPHRGRGPRALRPNAGVEAAFRKRLLALVDDMQASFAYWIRAAYRKNEPAVVAMDATPAAELQAELNKLGKRWRKQFTDGAPELASWFARSTARRSDAALKDILKRSGYSVRFTMTPAMRDIARATVEQNVQLIKSIPEQYLTEVQGLVMRSVQTGRDLGTLTQELEQRYGITRRRAALIARDQNNKATSAMSRVRQVEIGITKCIWQHSHGGKKPRKTHYKNSGKVYDPAVGWFDPDPKVQRHIWPGELINCRCVPRPVIPGFS